MEGRWRRDETERQTATRFYGVTMDERGVSQLVSVDLEAAVKLKEAV